MQDYSEVKLCECGCGAKVSVGKRFILGHNIAKPVEKVVMHCEWCGKEKHLRPSEALRFRFCSRSCSGKYGREVGTLPVGSKKKDPSGYIYIKTLDGWILEHRFIMSQYLGREILSNEDVHHINGVKDDNRIENLQLISRSDHTKLHIQEKWDEIFSQGYRVCRDCGDAKSFDELTWKDGKPSTLCRDCYNLYRKEWRK